MILLARYWYLIAIALLLAAIGLQNVRIENVKKQRDEFKSAATQLALAKDASERLRKADQEAAKGSFDRLSASCSQAFSAALEKGRAIYLATNKPAPAGGGRAIVSHDELQSIYGQAEPSR